MFNLTMKSLEEEVFLEVQQQHLEVNDMNYSSSIGIGSYDDKNKFRKDPT
jgi:hypothetical protein